MSPLRQSDQRPVGQTYKSISDQGRGFSRNLKQYGSSSNATGGCSGILAVQEQNLPESRAGSHSEDQIPATVLRQDLERVVHPGVRVFLGRPRGINHENKIYPPNLPIYQFLNESRDGQFLLGFTQETKGTFIFMALPFLQDQRNEFGRLVVDTMYCVMTYRPGTDVCDLYSSDHSILLSEQDSGETFTIERKKIGKISPGIWKLAVLQEKRTGGMENDQWRKPLVEFLLLRRNCKVMIAPPEIEGEDAFQKTITLADGSTSNLSPAADRNDTITEFIMATVDGTQDGKRKQPDTQEKHDPPSRSTRSKQVLSQKQSPVSGIRRRTLFDLQTNETAHITEPTPSKQNIKATSSRQKSAPSCYKLKSLKPISKSPIANVFVCKYRDLQGPSLVAKILNPGWKGNVNLSLVEKLWRTETTKLENLAHVSIIRLFCFCKHTNLNFITSQILSEWTRTMVGTMPYSSRCCRERSSIIALRGPGSTSRTFTTSCVTHSRLSSILRRRGCATTTSNRPT